MQPYCLPYLGYFQLISHADVFVVYDDVDFIIKGWINRNRILVNKQEHRFTIPLGNGRRGIPINQVSLAENYPQWRKRFLQTIRLSYARAPYFQETISWLEHSLSQPFTKITELNLYLLQSLCTTLSIKTELRSSSSIYQNKQLRGAPRLIDICKQENASEYLNPPGGRSLYTSSDFEKDNIQLKFLQPDLPPYGNPAGPLIPGLSILDALMHVSIDDLSKIVQLGKVIPANSDTLPTSAVST